MARQYLKLTSDWDEDDKIATLPDLAQLTFVKVLSRAKRQRPQGSFGSLAHLHALLPDRLHKQVQVLLKAGVLSESEGRVVVAKWGTYQVDPTATERVKRYRETQNDRSNNGVLRLETRDLRLETRDLRQETKRLSSFSTPGDVILGRKNDRG
jgi:hypothetical protein